MGGSGNFLGHALPAIYFIGIGGFFLLLTLRRYRDLQRNAREHANDDPRSFSDAYLPESNHRLILHSGLVTTVCSVAGFIYHAFAREAAHNAMYLTFFFVGAVSCLEGCELLFPNTHRCAWAFAFLLQYILWYEHAIMKEEAADIRVHMLQAQVNLVAFLTFGYSAYNPKSVFAYVASWASVLLNGFWMFTAGLNACCIDMMAHAVGSALVLEALFIGTLIVLGIACFLKPRPYHRTAKYEYSSAESEENVYDDAAVVIPIC